MIQIVKSSLHTSEVSVAGEDIDVIDEIRESRALGVVRQPEKALLQRLGQRAQPLLGLPLRLDGLLVGQVGLAGDGAGPDEGVAEDGALEELLVVAEDLLGGLAEEDLLLRSEVLGRVQPLERLLPQQRHPGRSLASKRLNT